MTLNPTALGIEPLCDLHDRQGFRCSERNIQNFFRGGIADANRVHNIRAFVACEKVHGSPVGFYYLTATSIEHAQLPQNSGSDRVPLQKVPAIYLGMIGVHKDYERCGLGQRLMLHAFDQVCKASKIVGVWAMTLDAISEDVVPFYERWDFRRFSADSLQMYLPLGTILRALTED